MDKWINIKLNVDHHINPCFHVFPGPRVTGHKQSTRRSVAGRSKCFVCSCYNAQLQVKSSFRHCTVATSISKVPHDEWLTLALLQNIENAQQLNIFILNADKTLWLQLKKNLVPQVLRAFAWYHQFFYACYRQIFSLYVSRKDIR